MQLLHPVGKKKGKLMHTRLAPLLLLLLPTLLTLGLFSFYPKLDMFVMSLFDWRIMRPKEFIGLDNYRDAIASPQFAKSFELVWILLVANFLKMWPAIFAAIALHRLASDRLRNLFQSLFVVPLIIPLIVWLLLWKGFYEPYDGLVNKFLNSTGIMPILASLDQMMPRVHEAMDAALISPVIVPILGGLGGLFFVAILLLALHYNRQPSTVSRGKLYVTILVTSFLELIWIVTRPMPAALQVLIIGSYVLLCLYLIFKHTGEENVLWLILLSAGVIVFAGEFYRLSLLAIVCIGLHEGVHYATGEDRANEALKRIGYGLLIVATLLIALGGIWTTSTGQFADGHPVWLGSENLIRPALIMWGFPWVGTVSVLLLLSGLRQINRSIYDAAELDGMGPLGIIFRIEIPLIMTQIRINIVFLTIATFVQYEVFFILLGADGGANNMGLVPSLYMYSQAFTQGQFGFAAALGVVIFVVIVALTMLYHRYLKVEK